MTTPADATTGPPEPLQAAPPPAPTSLTAALVDVLVVAAWSVGAGLIGALVWVQVVHSPQVTRTGGSATEPSVELAKQVGIDSWFAVIALAGGVLSGAILVWLRKRDPVLTVVLLTLGAGLSSWLMIHVGKALGPDYEIAALRKLPDGSHVSQQLRLHATGVAWIWPIAAAFGALIYLWVIAKPGDDREQPANLP